MAFSCSKESLLEFFLIKRILSRICRSQRILSSQGCLLVEKNHPEDFSSQQDRLKDLGWSKRYSSRLLLNKRIIFRIFLVNRILSRIYLGRRVLSEFFLIRRILAWNFYYQKGSLCEFTLIERTLFRNFSTRKDSCRDIFWWKESTSGFFLIWKISQRKSKPIFYLFLQPIIKPVYRQCPYFDLVPNN